MPTAVLPLVARVLPVSKNYIGQTCNYEVGFPGYPGSVYAAPHFTRNEDSSRCLGHQRWRAKISTSLPGPQGENCLEVPRISHYSLPVFYGLICLRKHLLTTLKSCLTDDSSCGSWTRLLSTASPTACVSEVSGGMGGTGRYREVSGGIGVIKNSGLIVALSIG